MASARKYVAKRIHPTTGRPKKPRVYSGRPSKWQDAFVEIAKSLAQLGHTDQEIADKLKISRSIYYSWQESFPQFSDAIRAGRASNLTGLSFKALTKALEGGIRKKTRNVIVKDAKGVVREIREENEALEVWPCKDTALRHLSATDPAYKGIADKAQIPTWVNNIQANISSAAGEIRSETITITPEQDAKAQDDDDK